MTIERATKKLALEAAKEMLDKFTVVTITKVSKTSRPYYRIAAKD